MVVVAVAAVVVVDLVVELSTRTARTACASCRTSPRLTGATRLLPADEDEGVRVPQAVSGAIVLPMSHASKPAVRVFDVD